MYFPYFISSSDFHSSAYKMTDADSQSGTKYLNYLVVWADGHMSQVGMNLINHK